MCWPTGEDDIQGGGIEEGERRLRQSDQTKRHREHAGELGKPRASALSVPSAIIGPIASRAKLLRRKVVSFSCSFLRLRDAQLYIGPILLYIELPIQGDRLVTLSSRAATHRRSM